MDESNVSQPDPSQSTPNPTPTPTPAQPQQQNTPPQTETPNVSTTVPTQGQQQLQVTPRILTPQHTGFRGMLDRVLDAISGDSQPKVYTDQSGNQYKVEKDLTTGQKVMRVAQLGLTGAAAGFAAGKGAGNEGKALAAGVQQGTGLKQGWGDQEKQAQDQVRQNRIDQANATLRQQEIAKNQFQLSDMQVEATERDRKFADTQEQHEEQLGSSLLGTYTYDDLHKIQEQDPNFWKNHYANRTVPIPYFDPETGKAAGIKVYLRPPGVNDQVMPRGTTLHVYVPPKGPGEAPTFEEVTPTDPMTRGQWTAFQQGEYSKYQAYQMDQAKLAHEQKEGTTDPLEAELKRSEIAKNKVEATEAGLRARKTSQEIQSAANNNPQNPRFETIAQALERGDILPADLKREAKGADLDPNEVLGRAMEIARDKGEEFSLPIIQQEHKFASSPKTQAALDGIDRMLGTHSTQGYLDQMIGYAQKAGLSNFAPWNDLKLGVQRWGGDAAAKNFNTAISETRRSIAGLIGNPLLGGGETDKKLEQADELLGKNPTMANIQQATGILKAALNTQRQSMVENNRYLRQRYGTGAQTAQPQQSQPQQQQAPTRPKNVPDNAVWNPSANNGRGAWQLHQ